MKLSEAINKYDLDIHLIKYYEIYNDNTFEREVKNIKEIGKDVYITLK